MCDTQVFSAVLYPLLAPQSHSVCKARVPSNETTSRRYHQIADRPFLEYEEGIASTGQASSETIVGRGAELEVERIEKWNFFVLC